jgi:tRNA U34 5-carboxymethylaminomethyl modifying enzyme MnmG/GidA
MTPGRYQGSLAKAGVTLVGKVAIRGARSFAGVAGAMAQSRIGTETAVVQGAAKFLGASAKTATKIGGIVPFVPVIIDAVTGIAKDIQMASDMNTAVSRFKSGQISAAVMRQEKAKFDDWMNPFARMGRNIVEGGKAILQFFSPIAFTGWN